MNKFLFFSLLAFSTVAFCQTGNLVASAPAEAQAAASPHATMPQGLNTLRDNQTNASETDRTCLRIHAFVFKTDDDRVPQLVRETTCMPASGHTLKKATGTLQPKLVPATDGSSF